MLPSRLPYLCCPSLPRIPVPASIVLQLYRYTTPDMAANLVMGPCSQGQLFQNNLKGSDFTFNSRVFSRLPEFSMAGVSPLQYSFLFGELFSIWYLDWWGLLFLFYFLIQYTPTSPFPPPSTSSFSFREEQVSKGCQPNTQRNKML